VKLVLNSRQAKRQEAGSRIEEAGGRWKKVFYFEF
jgi:hypothetical protein